MSKDWSQLSSERESNKKSNKISFSDRTLLAVHMSMCTWRLSTSGKSLENNVGAMLYDSAVSRDGTFVWAQRCRYNKVQKRTSAHYLVLHTLDVLRNKWTDLEVNRILKHLYHVRVLFENIALIRIISSHLLSTSYLSEISQTLALRALRDCHYFWKILQ